MSDYIKFTEELRENVARRMGEGYKAEVHQVAKANAGVMDALTIFDRSRGNMAGPNFYLLPLFGEYRNGRSMEAIAEGIETAYHGQAADMEELVGSLGDIGEYESYKDRIYFRLIHTGRNGAFLKDMPHFEVLDLSMVFYILVREDDAGIGAVPIKNCLLETWGIPPEELRKQAERNTPELFPVKVIPLAAAVMAALLKGEGEDGCACRTGDAAGSGFGKSCQEEPFLMTNARGINGFAAVLYPDALKDFSALTGKDLYVLPSSLHEAVLLPADISLMPWELGKMVGEVNTNAVADADVLSGSVYYYDRKKNELSIAGEEGRCVRL